MAFAIPSHHGACASLIHSIDWSRTSVGPMERWPVQLRSVLQLMLHSRHPMFLWWGPELVQFYNDAYLPSFGAGKHPAAMGQRGEECWQEIWPIIGPQIEGVMTRGEPTWHEDALVPIFRNGRIEEVYWTYGYSPVIGEGETIGGTLVVCTETTSRVVAHRQQRLLHHLMERIAAASTPTDVARYSIDALATDAADIPFAALFDASGACVHSVGLAPQDLDKLVQQLPNGDEHTLPHPIASGPWPESVERIFCARDHQRVLVFGVSPRLSFTSDYRDFLLQVAGMMREASMRLEAIAARAEALAERSNLLQQAPVATALMMGPEHTFELANKLYEEMVGRKVTGKTYREAFPELVATSTPTILDEVYRNGVPFVTEELLIPLDRGQGVQNCYFKFNLEPIRNAKGVVVGMMAVAVDITELVRARDERLALIESLEEANRAKDEFLALLGHELRNPLAPIITALDLIAARGPDPAAREHEIIARQATHLTRLVDDLIDVARIVRGKVELRREVVSLSHVVDKAIEIARHLVEGKRHQLEVQLPPDIRWWGDPVRLSQVIANLLTNAARYTAPNGSITLAVVASPASIEISVIDTGRGIAPEFLPKVFDRFAQATPSQESGGLGIGLTLVKSLVELHGGSVTATSEGLGRGSTFTVTLPREALPDREATRIAEPRDARGKRILLVDDNVDAALIMADVLRRKGHVVEVTHDGPAALATVKSFVPDVALMDIGLPVMSGYELARRLTETLGKDRVRMIALTGYGRERDREEAQQAGFHLHLVKPVTFAVLLRAIEADEARA